MPEAASVSVATPVSVIEVRGRVNRFGTHLVHDHLDMDVR